jgi:radical SAM superfamily enzyme
MLTYADMRTSAGGSRMKRRTTPTYSVYLLYWYKCTNTDAAFAFLKRRTTPALSGSSIKWLWATTAAGCTVCGYTGEQRCAQRLPYADVC